MRAIQITWTFTILLISVANFISAQEAKDFFSKRDLKTTWLGVDFSEVRVLGDEVVTPIEMKDKYFVSINDVVINEPEKYDFAEAFKKSIVENDLTMIKEINSKINVEKIKTHETTEMLHIDREMIYKMVSKYDFGDKRGFGIVFIMEGMNKTSLLASMYVTIINLDTKKVVTTKRMTAKPMGFGFRNYWARTVYNVLKDIKKSGL